MSSTGTARSPGAGAGSGGGSIGGGSVPAGLASLIETVLDVEQLEDTLFRGTRLWKPVMARAVFGGQVIAQALMSCCRTVDLSRFTLHSLHSYFLLGGDPAVPIIYHVERVRDGASYVTRTCSAVQRGRAIFSMQVSFHSVREAWSTEHGRPMPAGAPDPQGLPDERARLQAIADDPRLPDRYRPFVTKQLQQSSPIDLRFCRQNDPLVPLPEEPHQLVWMRARGTISDNTGGGAAPAAAAAAQQAAQAAQAAYAAPASTSTSRPVPTGVALALHQCVAAYASDFALLGTALLPHGSPNPDISMMASIDHSMWFHHPFRADEWLLYDLESPRLCHGRGFALGRIYTRDGTLVASTAQEGVIRFRFDAPPAKALAAPTTSLVAGAAREVAARAGAEGAANAAGERLSIWEEKGDKGKEGEGAGAGGNGQPIFTWGTSSSSSSGEQGAGTKPQGRMDARL
jgi:acyl-CoA thioesterase II